MDLLRAHALLDAVDSRLSWGFTTRRVLPAGSIRTGDRRTGGVVAELLEALEAVSVDDLHTLSAPELLDRARSLVTVINRAQAELSRTVRRAELAQTFEHDGMRSPQAWLRGHCRLSPAAARQLVRNGRALTQLPATAAGTPRGR
jgi:hypothetical protein